MNQNRKNPVMKAVIALLTLGAMAVVLPVAMQEIELLADAAEYDALRETAKAAAPANAQTAQRTDEPLTGAPEDADEATAQEHAEGGAADAETQIAAPPEADANELDQVEQAEAAPRKTGADLRALFEQNADFVAWIEIPGTSVDYPVVRSDDTDYYLNHTFGGKKSKLGTLLSLSRTDYETPGRNIAVFGHNINSSGKNMFRELHSYKDMAFYAQHPTIYFDSIYRPGTYTVFAVVNMRDGEWDPALPALDDAYLRNVIERAMYDTGIDVDASDDVLTLITCDRGYSNPDGRLIVMAVKQQGGRTK